MNPCDQRQNTASTIYARNLELLCKRFPDFEHTILPCSENADSFKLLPARSGCNTALIDGKAICSRVDPEAEAHKIIEQSLPPNPGCVVMVHTGLGYRMKALVKKYPELPIIIAEPDIPLFLEVIKYFDLTEVLEKEEVILLLGVPINTVITVLGELRFFGSLEVLVHRGLHFKDKEYTENLLKKIKEFSARRDVNRNTLRRFGKTWLRNLFQNIYLFPKTHSLDYLHHKMGSKPALILAAGPSLDILTPCIKELYDRFIIIAVDTAFTWCRIHDIQPDFLVVIDPQFWNTRHLEFPTGNPVIISESSTHPLVFRLCKGTFFFCKSLFPLGSYFDSIAGISGKLGAGGSVSTSAWDFAHYLTKGDVYIAGLDLGFPELSTHYKGSYFEERSHRISSRLKPASDAHFHALRDGNPFLAENNQGKKTLTDQRLIIYKEWFENQLSSKLLQNDFNLSPQGIKIHGMPYKKLQELLSFPVIRPEIAIEVQSAMQLAKYNKSVNLSDLSNGLSHLQELAKKALDLIEDISGNQEERARNHALQELDAIDMAISNSTYKDIAGFLIEDITCELMNSADPLSGSKKLYKHLQNSLSFHLQHIGKHLKKMQLHTQDINNY